MARRVDGLVRNAAPFELREERLEPERMLEENCDRLFHFRAETSRCRDYSRRFVTQG